MIRVIIAWLIVVLVLVGLPAFAECRHLYRVHHAQHIVQPIVHQNIFYSVGESLIQQSKIEREVEKQVAAKLQQLQSPAQQQVAPAGVFATKCAKCHKGDNALTGSADTFKAFARMAGLGEGIPNEMRAVISGLSPSEKGELTEYLLRLKSEPQVTIPQPVEGRLE